MKNELLNLCFWLLKASQPWLFMGFIFFCGFAFATTILYVRHKKSMHAHRINESWTFLSHQTGRMLGVGIVIAFACYVYIFLDDLGWEFDLIQYSTVGILAFIVGSVIGGILVWRGEEESKIIEAQESTAPYLQEKRRWRELKKNTRKIILVISLFFLYSGFVISYHQLSFVEMEYLWFFPIVAAPLCVLHALFHKNKVLEHKTRAWEVFIFLFEKVGLVLYFFYFSKIEVDPRTAIGVSFICVGSILFFDTLFRSIKEIFPIWMRKSSRVQFKN